MLHYSFFALTDPGRVRSNNEDALAFDAACGLAVLADGMGGYNAGEVASGMAVRHIKTELMRYLSDPDQANKLQQAAQVMTLCVEEANLSILNASLSNPHYAGMGTTLVVGIFQDERLILGHVGDSRCYRLRGGRLAQITKDHSMLQEQVDAGVLTPAQAAVSPGKNLLTRALGVEDRLRVDVFEHSVLAGDAYLMCSDGLTDMLDNVEIMQILSQPGAGADKVNALVTEANARGGRDNISVLLVQAAAEAQTGRLLSRWFSRG